jgi:hypothetical protein
MTPQPPRIADLPAPANYRAAFIVRVSAIVLVLAVVLESVPLR